MYDLLIKNGKVVTADAVTEGNVADVFPAGGFLRQGDPRLKILRNRIKGGCVEFLG